MSTMTVDVPDNVLEKAMSVAGATSPQQVIVKALEEYAQRHDQKELIQYLGTSDGFMTLEQLSESRESE